jgi:hypothetical protein
MPTGVLPLSELAKRLSRKESEVDRLRHQYETRLEKLKARRQKLESELREIEAQIPAASPNGSVPPAQLQEEPIASASGRMILKDFLLTLIKQAGKPLTIRELAEEVRRRKYPTKSKNIPDLVQVRVYDMAKKGVLAHATGQPGFVVGSANGQPGNVRKKARIKRGPGRKAKVTKASVPAGRASQPPLREVLTKILEKRKEPLGGPELAQKALATGYQSQSKNFGGVVSVSLAQMNNVEHIHGQGYRLKKR